MIMCKPLEGYVCGGYKESARGPSKPLLAHQLGQVAVYPPHCGAKDILSHQKGAIKSLVDVPYSGRQGALAMAVVHR
jgi:hypothetical protein